MSAAQKPPKRKKSPESKSDPELGSGLEVAGDILEPEAEVNETEPDAEIPEEYTEPAQYQKATQYTILAGGAISAATGSLAGVGISLAGATALDILGEGESYTLETAQNIYDKIEEQYDSLR